MSPLKNIHYAWCIFAGCCSLAVTVTGLILSTMGLFFTYVAPELGFSMTQAALLISVMNLAIAGSMPVVGRLLPAIRVRLVFTACAFVCGGGFMLSASFHTYPPFILLWICIGLVTPLLMGISVPVLLGNWFHEKTGMVMGIVTGIAGLGGALFNYVIGKVIPLLGWRLSYVVCGIVILVLLLPFTLFVLKIAPEGDGQPYGYHPSQSTSTFDEGAIDSPANLRIRYKLPFFLVLAANIASTTVTGFHQLLPSHIVEAGHPISVVGAVMAGLMVGLSLGNVTMGLLLDRLGPPKAILIGCLLGAAGWAGLMAATGYVLLLVWAFLAGVGQSVTQVGIPYLLRAMYGNAGYGAAYGLVGGIGAVACSACALAGGSVYDIFGNYNHLLRCFPVLYTLVASLAICAYRCNGGRDGRIQ